jgi:arylsulfatase A-like enzyme
VGAPLPAGLDGVSFRRALDGNSGARSELFLAYRGVQRAVRDARYKLIVYPQVHRRQLFDLVSDPDETKDVAGDPKQAARIDAMTRRLESLQRQFGDSQPLAVAEPSPPVWRPPSGEELDNIRARWRMPPLTRQIR